MFIKFNCNCCLQKSFTFRQITELCECDINIRNLEKKEKENKIKSEKIIVEIIWLW